MTTPTALRLTRIIAFSLIARMCFVAHAASPVVLTQDGKPAATIVLADKPTRSAQFAAAELQVHIQKITGATLPVVGESATVEGTRILIGESRATLALKLRNADFTPQEYLVRVRRGLIVLMGRDKEDRGALDYQNETTFPRQFDEQGTCYAMYDFLEKFCAVRWLLPTDLGIVHPTTPTLTVRPGEVRRAPVMKYRFVPDMYPIPADLCGDTIKGPQPFPKLSKHEQALWYARCRVGGEPYAINHSLYGYYGRFLTQHPDWFAQGYKGKPPQMCFTNPQFIQQVVQDARDYFDGKGLQGGTIAAGDYFAVVPMDGVQWCKCERCQAELLGEPTRGKGLLQNDIASDYIFGFVNKVAREVRKTHPDKFISCLAYTNYSFPPRHVRLEPNVVVTLCLLDRLVFQRALQETNRRIIRAWAAESRSRRKFLWLYLCYPAIVATRGDFRCFPGFYAHSLVDDLHQYHRYRIRGVSFEPSYLADYYQSPLLDQLETYLIWKLADDPSRDTNKLIEEFFRLYYGAAAGPMRQLYEAIEKVYSNPSNYPEGLAKLDEEFIWGYLGTERRMAEFAKLMDASRAAAQTDLEKKRVALFEKGIWNYMEAGREAFLEHAKLRVPTLQQAHVPGLIQAAHGDARKVDWSQAAILSNWRELKGDPTDRKVEARLAHDGEFLYVRLEERLDPRQLVRKADEVWDEDEWEIFFARQRVLPYRQMGINAAGSHIDLAHGEESEKWDSGAAVDSDTSTSDRWQVYLAFPFAKLLPGGVKMGDTIYMNILRSTEFQNTLAWIPTFAGFHEPRRFGEIKILEQTRKEITPRTQPSGSNAVVIAN